MPPRIPPSTFSRISSPPTSSRLLPTFLTSTPSCRHASILSSLSDNPSAYAHVFRRGRGPSSGKGKTSGRGHKGQKQHGKVPRAFNGGQTPLEVVHGKRGAVNVFSVDMQTINLSKITSWVAQGRLDPARPITIRELAISRCVTGIKDGVKLLADGSETLAYPLHIVVSRASSTSIAAVEKAGGSVLTRYYSPFAIRKVIRGTMDPINSLSSAPNTGEMVSEIIKEKASGFQHRLPDPTSRKDIEYYRDAEHRGYLSHTVAEGQGPSLFFRAPGTGVYKKKIGMPGTGKMKAAAGANRIW